MKKRTLWVTILCLLTGLQFLNAQTTDPSDSTSISETGSTASNFNPNYPPFETGFYIGARGGYVLKNKSLSENPLYFLGSGMFAELNGGWRKQSFGWDLSLGTLNIKRDVPQGAKRQYNVDEVLRNTTPADPSIDRIIKDGAGKDAYFDFSQSNSSTSAKTGTNQAFSKNFNGYYALTGPRLWLGTQQLQFSLYAQGGVIMRNFGYYSNETTGTSTEPFVYQYGSPREGVTTTTISADLKLGSQYGAPETVYNQITDGSSSFEGIKEKRKTQFMGRGGINIDYFLSKKASIYLGVDYWYIPSPEMKGGKQYVGSVNGSTISPSVVITPEPLDPSKPILDAGNITLIGGSFSNQTKFSEKKNLGMLSASLGVKVWLGKQKEKPAPPPPVVTPAPIPAERSLVVKVIDKPTGQPLAGVSITIAKAGSSDIIQTMTMEDGTIPALKGIDPANYDITGEKNGVAATSASVSADDFNKAATVYRELVLNDLRFTLAGKTINKEAQTGLPFIQTSLTNVSKGTAEQRASDSTGKFSYQLEQNSDYNVIAQNKGYFSNKEKVTTRGLNRSEVIYVNLALEVVELKKDASIVLKDIYYDYNSANIRPDAALVLDNLVKMLQENPVVNIELSSHTDSRGGDAFNLDLSRKRANAAVRYLISKGIASKRLTAKGYGETRLLNNCGNDANCTEEEHQLNRRTEIKILE